MRAVSIGLPANIIATTATPCPEAGTIAAAIERAIRDAGDRPDDWVTLQLPDLRRMDGWGLRIQGQSLYDYFDLGSIDDVEPDYPVTKEEARLLMAALAEVAGCAEVTRCTEARAPGAGRA
ncbi:hypothetical protein [Paracidovorax citrulli]